MLAKFQGNRSYGAYSAFREFLSLSGPLFRLTDFHRYTVLIFPEDIGNIMNEMPSKKQYDLVSDDGYDSRIPLHNEDAFAHGIQFGAKYIGTLDVPRPSSRVEIVAAMRRIRYEFKAKAIKKKKVTLTVSVDGVKVMMRKKKKKSQWHWDDNRLMVMHHPIYRIFYVSHDSQDLKIWSYIARDGSTNVFKCNVFKAYKKNQAMRIVRTIGQAFEVCHKLSVSNITNNSENQEDVEGSEHSDEVEQKTKHKEAHLESEVKGNNSVGSPGSQKSSSILPTELALKQAQQLLNSMEAKTPGETITSPLGSPVLLGEVTPNPELPLSSHHQLQLLRQQLEQQQQQTQVAIAQVHLLKDQLAAETAARIEAQARTHQLLLHNRDLLDHASTLINRLQELEVKISGISTVSEVVFQTPPQVQIPVLPDPTTPQAGPVYLPEFQELDMSYLQTVPDIAMFKNTKTDLDTDSPDSGHKEMSSDSLSLNLHQSENSWHSTTVNNGSGLSNPYNKTPVSINCSQNGFHTPPSQPLGRHCASMSTSFSQSNGLYNPFSYSDSSYSNGSSSTFNATPSPSCDVEDKVKIITPLPPQDASGNRLDLGQNTPKIEPPPQNKRSVRPGHMNLSRDKTGYRDNNANISNNSEYYSPHTTVNTGSIRDATPGTWSNLCREFAHNHSHSRSHNMNNNYEADSKIIYETGSNFQASQDLTTNVVNGHESNRSTTLNDVMDVRLHITNPSDDENTENSEDSGLPPHNLPRRLDSMTFDEFDALSN